MRQNKSSLKQISFRPAKKGFLLSFIFVIGFIGLSIFIETKLKQTNFINDKTSVFLTVLSLLLAFIIFVYIHLRVYSTKLIISEPSLVLEEGILNKHHLTVRYPNITEIGVKQNFFARMLDYGNLYIITSGAGKKHFSIDKISHPLHVKNLIEKFSGMNR